VKNLNKRLKEMIEELEEIGEVTSVGMFNVQFVIEHDKWEKFKKKWLDLKGDWNERKNKIR